MVELGPTPGFIDVDLSIAALKRNRSRLLLGMLVGLVLSLALAFAQPNDHRSWATVVVKPIGVDVSRGSTGAVDAIVERELARSFLVAERAAERVGISAEQTDEIRNLRRDVTVRSIESRPILEFSFADTNPEFARDVANAFAESYLEVRLEQAGASITDSIEGLDRRRAEIQTELQAIERTLVDAAVDSAEFRAGINTQGVLIAQATSLGNDIARLEAVPLDPGQLISPAQLSQSSTRARMIPIVVAGTILGGMLGLLAALFIDRRSRKDTLDDIELVRLGVPALAHLPRRVGGADAHLALRRTVVAGLAERGVAVVGVTTISPAGPPAMVASWLAIGLSQDHRVLLISADFESHGLTRQLGLQDSPGLLDALAEDRPIAEVRHQRGSIDVVGAGRSTGDPEFLVRLVGIRGILERARAEYDFVVVSAPGLLDHPTAHLATFATDGTILVVDDTDGRSRVERGASVLRRSGGNLLGSIVLSESAALAEE